MKQTNDETILSSFLDGELDPTAMAEADTLLEKDAAARRYVRGLLAHSTRRC